MALLSPGAGLARTSDCQGNGDQERESHQVQSPPEMSQELVRERRDRETLARPRGGCLIAFTLHLNLDSLPPQGRTASINPCDAEGEPRLASEWPTVMGNFTPSAFSHYWRKGQASLPFGGHRAERRRSVCGMCTIPNPWRQRYRLPSKGDFVLPTR